ncbi:MAG: ATP-dependent DNA helicase [bacterium]|nr:ATP-dependent DNA helicase [bacterium]MDE0644220.1 ATP-dependent DNA helicase [bacterium]MYD03383.1 ATP-dependent helicase [Acidimicrobiia bacterium]
MTTRPDETASAQLSERAIEHRLHPGDWEDAIACTEGPQLVIAGPGAGKTEFLVRRFAYLVDHQGVPGSDILSLAFSRRAATDFGNRLHTSVVGSVGGVGASTFHAFAYRLLERYGPEGPEWTGLPSILTGPEQVDLVSELLASDPPHRWPVLYRRLLKSRTLAHEVTDFILRARESMIQPSRLARTAEEYPDWRALPAFMARYDQELERRDRIDYGTLMARAIEVLRIRKSVEDGPAYRYVLVDEYQDSTRAQAALLRELVEEPANLTVAADPYQSIYGFRGADLSNLARFQEYFRLSDPVRRWILSTSFRTPAEILRAAERLTLGAGLQGAAGPVEPAPQPGQVEIRVFGQQSEEAEWIATQAVRLHIEQGVPYSRMAVLVRTKRRLLKELSRALEQRSIPHDRPDIRLADHPATRIFLDIARAAARADQTPPHGSEPADLPIRRLLLGPLFNLGVGELRGLERRRRQQDITWPQTLRLYLDEGEVLADLLEEPSWTEHTAIDGFWKVWTRLPQLQPLVDGPSGREFRAAWSSLAQTLARVADRDPGLTLLDYLRLIESDDFEASPLLSYRDPTEDRMALTTLHQAKGLDFDVVFIADVVEGVLPDLARHQSLLRIDRLDGMDPSDADPPSESPTFSTNLARRKRLQEETRLLYTAITRACQRVFLTATTAGPDETQRRPSRFLEILGGPGTTEEDAKSGKPVTFHEAEIWLRRLLVDPAESDHRRLAAVTVLASPSTTGIRHPSRYAPLRRVGADQGLLTTGRRLSPTDAIGYNQCPRRFATERLLSARTGDSPYLTFGSLIHNVLEKAEQQTISTGQRPDLDQIMALMETEIEQCDFGTTVEQEAWRRRAVELLTSLFTTWPHPDARPVLLEQPVTMKLGGFDWRGRIDRIEQNPDGTLRLVDYKTGKNPTSKVEAGQSLQLGFYYLAANADPTVSRLGTATEAEFWFPLKTAQSLTIRKFQPDREAAIRAELKQIAQAIRAEDWSPRPGPDCDRCEVRMVCPDWPEGQEAFRR